LPLKLLLSALSDDSFLNSIRILIEKFFISFYFLYFYFLFFFFFPIHSHPEFLALFAGSSNLQTTNHMNEKFVYRLRRVFELTAKKKRVYLYAVADRLSF